VSDEQLRHDLCYNVVEQEYFFGAVNKELKKAGMHLTITGREAGYGTDLDEINYDELTKGAASLVL
jgi:hypothetical protein